MKALTLWQPWASLVALGMKTIETRSWSTSYRGPLAIHAAARPAEVDEPQGLRRVGDWWVEDDRLGGFSMHAAEDDAAADVPLPLGAVVATATLVDVVPMVGPDDALPPDFDRGLIVQRMAPQFPLVHPRGDAFSTTLTLFGPNDWWGDRPSEERDVTDQLPYGDFAPGRYAWLLDDIAPTTERCPACWGSGTLGIVSSTHGAVCSTCSGSGRCDPILARGRQRLWEWTP